MILFEAWRSFPFAFLFLTARMQAIPETLEEAATVDGATPTQRFRYIVLPQLLPTIAVLTVLRFIWTFNNFDDIYLLTGGGAGTQVVAVRVYDYLINRGDIGAAAAQALVLAAILAVLVGIYLKLFGRSGGSRMSTLSRDTVERRVLRGRSAGLHRVPARHLPLPLLLHGAAVVPAARRSAPGPGGAPRPGPARSTWAPTSDVLASTEDGGQGFLNFIKNSMFVAVGTVVFSACSSPSPAPTPSAGSSSSAGARSARSSWASTSSRRSCWRSRCSCSSPGSASAAPCPAC